MSGFARFRRLVPVEVEFGGLDEFFESVHRIFSQHEGPGHDIQEEVDKETGDVTTRCVVCDEILMARSPGFFKP